MKTKWNYLVILNRLVFFISIILLTTSPAFAGDDLDVIFSSAKSTYVQGDTVQVWAKVYYQNGAPVRSLEESSIKLKDSKGETVTESSMQKSQDGLFSFSYKLTDNAMTGSWGVKAHFHSHDGDNEGEWEGERSNLFQVALNSTDSGGEVPADLSIELSAETDKSAYNFGDTINLFAQAMYSNGDLINVSKKKIVIKDAIGTRVKIDNLIDGGNGNYIYSYQIPSGFEAGRWSLLVRIVDTSGLKKVEKIYIDVSDNSTEPPVDPSDVDNDNDGYTENQGDCNDSSAAINPSAQEICGDGIDQNCSGADLICPIDPNEVDDDDDGYTENQGDCNDNNAAVNPGAEEICGDGIDQDCSGADLICPIDPNDVDNDGDGYTENQGDCNDSNVAINPGATEITGNGIDENCNGMSDDAPTYSDNHYNNADCLLCHTSDATEVHGSVHYQWQGDTPYMINGGGLQGKLTNGVNSYCINIMGNWAGCSSCHVGKGAMPEPVATLAQLENIDCMKCHSEPGVLPTRVECLNCHAKAGGGDAVKRGDLALATGITADRNYDVHMATTGGNLECSSCHTTQNHRIAGKGSDLRPTDLDVAVDCSNCHSSSPHSSSTTNRHTARVACQTCHIPVYAKNAADTIASEATETHRTWRSTHATAAPFHPAADKANDLTPRYKFWNGDSNNYLLGDVAQLDPTTGAYPTSRPVGSSGDSSSKLYPFKYKTAEQPMTSGSKQLIALDTSIFFANADADASTRSGLVNMGLSENTTYEWVMTDTYQMLNHQVSPVAQALQCNNCHDNTSRMNLEGDLGYNLKGTKKSVCSQCHGDESYSGYKWVHDKHVTSKNYDCSWCHNFSRPERGLRKP